MARILWAISLAISYFGLPCGCYFLSGVGVGEITGPVADVNLMGYANPLQTAQGVHTRLFARAFVFAEPDNPSRRFAYVSMDACMASQLVTLRVVQQLKALYGEGVYEYDNVAISGTHTHASPAGFLQYMLYDITSLGFVKATFDAMVDGVVTAIRAAHDALRPSSLSLASGDLGTASVNRSPTAYLANPEEERSLYDTDVDTDMTLVRLADAASGAGVGALAWFAVHCTSLNNTNRLVSGDNKAAAQLAMEWWADEAEARAAAATATAGTGDGDGDGAPAAASPAEVSKAAAAAAAAAALGLEDLEAAAGGVGSDGRPAFRLRNRPQQPAGGAGSAAGGKGGGQQAVAAAGAAAAAAAAAGNELGEAFQSGDVGQAQSPPLLRFEPGFVAAVAQSSVGDTSPNTQGAFCLDTGLPCDPATSTCNGRNELCHGRGPAWPDDRASAAVIGARQFLGARLLYEAAAAPAQPLLSGPLDYRSAYLDMANTTVAASAWTREGRTCPPAMGMSFAAGTTDGPGALDFTQGDTRGPPLWRLLRNLLLPPSPQQRDCQAPKPILLDTGQITVPYLWQPRVTQISLLRLGRLIIVCVPGEFSTMAGRRLKRALRERFAAAAAAKAAAVAAASGGGGGGGDDGDGGDGGDGGGDDGGPVVVLSGLTGTYSSYVTTWEEYQVQRYEGASTLYGPYTLDAYIQEFLRLADSMIEGRPVTSAVQPPDLEAHQISLLAPVVLDWVPPGAAFGDVTEQPQPSYRPGQTARATFRAANPRNNLRTNLTFMAVELLLLPGAPASDDGEEPMAAPTTATASAWDWRWRARRRRRLLLQRGAGGGGGGGGGGSAMLAAAESPASPCGGGRGATAAAADGEWRVVYDDRDWVTRFHWTRPHKLSPQSFATLLWDIPPGTPGGTYRLRYFGDAKSLSGAITAFQGCSAPFTVTAPAAHAAAAAAADRPQQHHQA